MCALRISYSPGVQVGANLKAVITLCFFLSTFLQINNKVVVMGPHSYDAPFSGNIRDVGILQER